MRQRRCSFLPYLLGCAIFPTAGACSRGTNAEIAARNAARAAKATTEIIKGAVREGEAGGLSAVTRHLPPATEILPGAGREVEAGGLSGTTRIFPPAPEARVSEAQIVVGAIDKIKLDDWRKRYPFEESVIRESICAEIGHALTTKEFPTFDGFVHTVEGNLLGQAVPGGEALNAATEFAEMLYENSDMSLSDRYRILSWQIKECPHY